MWLLAAAISPGYFGFTNWAFAAEAPSEIAAQVPIATRKNNAVIIISSPILPCNQLAQNSDSRAICWKTVVPERGFGRCDGYHEIVDLRFTNRRAVEPAGSFARRTRQDVRTHPVKTRRDARRFLLSPLSPPLVPPRSSRPKLPLAAGVRVVAWVAITAIGAMATGAASAASW